MKAFIIEDEPLALERLKSLISLNTPDVQIVGDADSIESALEWFSQNTDPDVVLTDIQLADGNCFGIFEKYQPSCPLIFITAYTDYAIEAFKVNARDYLLKPVKPEDLIQALDRVRRGLNTSMGDIDYTRLAQAIIREEQRYDRRYLIRYGDQIRTVQSDEIAYIYTMHKAVFLVMFGGKEYPMDKTMDELEKELDPRKFFRINRQFIVNLKSITSMHTASKSRVQLDLNPPFKGDEVIVSTERSPLFKDWLGS
ncbi:MAG: hypothetical protein RL220_1439 [Bacteroidota bacterium]